MKNKTIVIVLLIGFTLSFIGGFLVGFTRHGCIVPTLISTVWTLLGIIFVIWGMVRLWKTPDQI